MKLKRDFFNKPTLQVAQDIIGKYIIFNNFKAKILETEAYIGENDPACHASVGKTKRNSVMYGPAGFSYVYFIYGMYFCLNFVTEKEGFPAAVLIRGLLPVSGIEEMKKNRKVGDLKLLTNGPGKLCQAFGINKNHNNINICKSDFFYVEDLNEDIGKIEKTPRIGIKVGKDLLYRFILI